MLLSFSRLEADQCAWLAHLDLGVLRFRAIGHQFLPHHVAVQKSASHSLAQAATLVESLADRRACPVYGAWRKRTGVVLSPVRNGVTLVLVMSAGFFPRLGHLLPRATTIAKIGVSQVAVFHQPGGSAVGRIVVVALKHVTKRADRHVVGIAHVMANGCQASAIGVHSHSHATYPDMPV